MEKTCSLRHDMAEYVSSYWKWEKLFGEQGFSGDIDNYWRKWVSAIIEECLLKGIKAKGRILDNQ